MNNKAIFLVAFLMGVGTGVAGSWHYAKKKYERIAQEEIDSVKEVFARRDNRPKDETGVKTTVEGLKDSEKPSISEYAAILQKAGYTDYSNANPEEKETEMADKPYVILPEAFGEDEDYECISLTYYADKILADENDEMIEDVEETVGFESLSHFGEYEDDSVYVKNDTRRCYYEILLDERDYSEVIKHMPHPVEV